MGLCSITAESSGYIVVNSILLSEFNNILNEVCRLYSLKFKAA